MSILQDIQKLAIKKRVPVIKPGYTVRVHQRIKEGEKERVQIFEGLVIKLNSGFGADKTFTVRRIVGGIGVERIFPLYSTNIIKIEVKKKSKVRRAKLYYMRDRFGKSARLKETFVSDKEKEMEEAIEELAEEKATETTETTEEVAEEKAEESTPEVAEEKPEEKTPEVTAEEAPAEEKKEEAEAPAETEEPKAEEKP